jgi:hypothetical protein
MLCHMAEIFSRNLCGMVLGKLHYLSEIIDVLCSDALILMKRAFMPERMPEKSMEFIEAAYQEQSERRAPECLKAARRAPGCSDLRSVRIGRIKPCGSGPNWEVLGFTPDLPEIAHNQALEAIAYLRQKYALPEKKERRAKPTPSTARTP